MSETLTKRRVVKSHLPTALERALLCARIADQQKARDILVLDMRRLTPLYDFMVIVTGQSRRQLHALVEEIDAAMQAVGDQRIGLEGYETGKWVIEDYGDVVVHIFDPPTREYYALEHLWADAPHVAWQTTNDQP
ncbi:MAG: ribosome silencing factor [Gemmatales bacterium]|nr:ribosome silencing factor [Gemmatales bacterium]MCS7160978.1 ribosome silencing factor [Gemmatales bacterium]MDW8176181.1 ribosome silencing factor [Gemmatales bacterium]MDW8222768.1 ribosome silencing factor [Gemmatales bacterium]